jgi:hypothetical protein
MGDALPDTPDASDADEPKLPLTVDSPIFWAELLIEHEALQAFYRKRNIKCFLCCAAEKETFAQGAKVHEGGPHGAFDAAKVVDELNALAADNPVKPEQLRAPTIAETVKSVLARCVDMLFPSKPDAK